MRKYCAKLKNHCRTLMLMITVTCIVTPGVTFAEQATQDSIERMFRGMLTAILDNRPNAALSIAEKSLTTHPNFRLTEILRGDLLAARAHQRPLMAVPQALQQQRVIGLKDEMLARFTYQPPQTDYLPQGILQLSPRHRFALMLDASQSRLYVFKNNDGYPLLINHYYTSIGTGGMGKTTKGDNKTPTGIYQIVSYLDDNELPELYGSGAYTLNYPSNWDRQAQRSGSGIWIHGVPRQLSSRPPQDSRGCIILGNTLIEELGQYLDLGETPVLLNQKITWLTHAAWQTQRAQLLTQVQNWHRDWESLNIEQYLSHYTAEYQTETQNYQQMLTRTRHNAKKKTFVEVIIKDIDLFINPSQPGLAQVVFDQDYRSNNYNIQYRKQQVWKYTDDSWKIIYEGKA